MCACKDLYQHLPVQLQEVLSAGFVNKNLLHSAAELNIAFLYFWTILLFILEVKVSAKPEFVTRK